MHPHTRESSSALRHGRGRGDRRCPDPDTGTRESSSERTIWKFAPSIDGLGACEATTLVALVLECGSRLLFPGSCGGSGGWSSRTVVGASLHSGPSRGVERISTEAKALRPLTEFSGEPVRLGHITQATVMYRLVARSGLRKKISISRSRSPSIRVRGPSGAAHPAGPASFLDASGTRGNCPIGNPKQAEEGIHCSSPDGGYLGTVD